MKNVIVGTAGHIDHGKTALVKALTGIDCDTHPEEKARGITINLGFAHIDYEDVSIGIVDVPGHRDFIQTMIAGAFGIDCVMMVIAADSGVMPQTVEHLRIMQLLGVQTGVIALTKADLVDAGMIGLAAEEIRDFTRGTFFDGCAIVPVSAVTGQGLDRLKDEVRNAALRAAPRAGGSFFRMFIDRIFSVAGAGTVVTGTSLGGRLRTGASVFLLPGMKKLRVRRIERHGAPVETVDACTRTSLNLSGIECAEIRRGMVVADKPIEPSTMLDCTVTLIEAAPVKEWRVTALFCLGTYSGEAKIRLLDTDMLRVNEEAIAQIYLPAPVIAMRGDRFIIRSTSGETTLGGGRIIDAYPLHHRRRRPALAGDLHRLAAGGTTAVIRHELSKQRLYIRASVVADLLGMEEADVIDDAAKSSDEIHTVNESGKACFVSAAALCSYEMKIVQTLERYHRRNPLDECGMTRDELAGIMRDADPAESRVFTGFVLDTLLEEQRVRSIGNTYVAGDFCVSLPPGVKESINFMEETFRTAAMHLLAAEEAAAAAARHGISRELLEQIVHYLVSKKRISCIQGQYVHADVVESCKRILLTHLHTLEQPVTVSAFRDMTNGNRKMCLLLLNHFDALGLTVRDGDYRRLTERGRMWLEERTPE